jgi:hypothetical protein
MHLRPLSGPNAALALWMIGSSLVPLPATAGDAAPTTALIAEVRRAFTLNGKQIPPEIFRDFGDGDLADSGSIMGDGRHQVRDRQQPLFRRD